MLQLFDASSQARRLLPSASSCDLFIHLHGLLFTSSTLQSTFATILTRFLDKLEAESQSAEGINEARWIMMGVVNLASLVEYGSEVGVIKGTLDVTSTSRGHMAPKTRMKPQPAAPQAIMLNSLRVGGCQ